MENKRSSPAFSLSRRIGSTNFRVNVYCSSNTEETFQDKIYRLIKNDAGNDAGSCGILTLPQTSRQSERSAS